MVKQYQEELGEMLARADTDNQAKFKTPDGCFLKPTPGRLVVAQDAAKSPSRIIHMPERSKARPTTGRVIACGIGTEEWMGKRILYGMMSGVAVQFKNRPAWIALSVDEIVAEIAATDEELDSDAPLPLDGSYGG